MHLNELWEKKKLDWGAEDDNDQVTVSDSDGLNGRRMGLAWSAWARRDSARPNLTCVNLLE